jgi:hypothetical protein
MNRRHALTVSAAAAFGASLQTAAPALANAAMRTRWAVRSSEGFDALALLGPLSGKPFYADHYRVELATFKPRLPADALTALDSLFAEADADGYLLWPRLALYFSGGPDATLTDLQASLRAADDVLRPPLQASVYWDAQAWQRFIDMRPRLQRMLQALKYARFAAFRAEVAGAQIRARQAQVLARLTRLDVIHEQERLLGRTMDPGIEVNLLWFCRPHGVKIQGQRFLAHALASDDALVLTAAHENLHPPLDMHGPTARACLAVLSQDALFDRILSEKNKDTGYNTLEGIFDEDTVQALDQLIQDRLGFGIPPRERWTRRDQGMHILAAGLYGLLKADRFDETGGNIEEWMAAAVADGRLAPAALHAAAAKVLGRPAEALWVTPGSRGTAG